MLIYLILLLSSAIYMFSQTDLATQNMTHIASSYPFITFIWGLALSYYFYLCFQKKKSMLIALILCSTTFIIPYNIESNKILSDIHVLLAMLAVIYVMIQIHLQLVLYNQEMIAYFFYGLLIYLYVYYNQINSIIEIVCLFYTTMISFIIYKKTA